MCRASLGINILEPKCGQDLTVIIGDDGWVSSDFIPHSVVLSHRYSVISLLIIYSVWNTAFGTGKVKRNGDTKKSQSHGPS